MGGYVVNNPDELIKKIFMYLDDGYDLNEIADFLDLDVEEVRQLIFNEENK